MEKRLASTLCFRGEGVSGHNSKMRKPFPEDSREGLHRRSGHVPWRDNAYADLRLLIACSARFAMNACRRLPRFHGISTSVCSAVAMIDLIKRVFMVLLFLLLLLGVEFLGLLPLVNHEIDRAFGHVWGRNKKTEKKFGRICCNFERFASIAGLVPFGLFLWEFAMPFRRNWHQ
jgi:hypothetical protein